MRTLSKSRTHFHGTHKGCVLDIERDADGRFYIFIQAPDGGYLYDGWAPDGVRRMPDAKREALYGACLKDRPSVAREPQANTGHTNGNSGNTPDQDQRP